MQGDATRLGVTFAAMTVLLAAVAALLAGFAAAWWVWTAFAIWGALWVTAGLGLGDAASRKFQSGTLRRSTYTQIYTTLTRRLLTRLWARLCDPVPEKAPWPAQFRAALTWRLYDRALLIALAYPMLLLVGQWVWTGEEGRIRSVVALPEAAFWPERALWIGFLLFLTAGFVAHAFASASQRPIWRKPAGGQPLFAVALAGTSAGVVAGTFEGVVAFLVMGAFVLACAVGYLAERNRARPALALTTVAVLLLAPAFALTLDWPTLPEDIRGLFLFLAVLPLLNALFDVLSCAATLSLTRRGLQSPLPLLWGLADLALACLLFLCLGATLVAAIHGLNLLAGVALMDLPGLFDGIRERPGAYVWIYAMLFSTIVPTTLHAALSLLGLQGIWPRSARRVVAGWIDAAPISPLATFRASLALGMIWTVPVLVLMGVSAALWGLSSDAILRGLARYLEALAGIVRHPLGAF
ncbi:MAG: DUF3488 domain-containing protein [Roseinatronobacter sp.]